MTGRIGYCMPSSGYSSAEQARRLAVLQGLAGFGMEVVPVSIEGSPAYLDSTEAFELAVAGGVDQIGVISPESFDVLILGGALDPGIGDLRAAARIPIVGPGEATMSVATVLNVPLSIITVHDPAVEVAQRFHASMGSPAQVVSIRSISMPLEKIMKDREASISALEREVDLAVCDDGVGCVILGAMTLGMFGVDRQLRDKFGVAVLNPVRCAVDRALEVIAAKRPDPSEHHEEVAK